MRLSSKRPPLPAPTESSLSSANNNINGQYSSDVATDLSHVTDRTHYSIPEDGREIRVPTKTIRAERTPASGHNSQTSLLIEYYDAGRSHDIVNGRPSVRVKVTPHARRVGKGTNLQVTEVDTARKPSYTRRISLNHQSEARGPPVSFNQHSEVSNISERSPIEFEIMGHQSELSELPPESNVSSMPDDSILDAPAKIQEPERVPSSSLGPTATRKENQVDVAKLKAPDVARSRSLSKERITRKALEKIARDQSPEPEKPRRLHKSRPRSSGSEQIGESLKPHSRRSSNSHRESSDLRSYTESSLLPPRDNESNLSGASKVSLSNPKLIATVEDAIRRIILPEIETLKRNQSVRSTRTRDSFATEDSLSRAGTGRRLSKATSEPYVKGRHLDETSSREGERRRRKHKKSSRDLDSDATSSRRDSLDSIAAEKERIRKSKATSRNRDNKSDSNSLTRANLKNHTSRSSVDDREHHRDKRKHSSKSKSQTDSTVEPEGNIYNQDQIPPLPMNSVIQDSELTRTSLLSAETAGTEDMRSGSDSIAQAPKLKTVPQEMPTIETASNKTPREIRSRGSRDLKISRSDRSIDSSKRAAAALAAAGLGGAAGALYGHKARESSRPSSRKSSAEKHASSREQTPSRSTPRSSEAHNEHEITGVESAGLVSDRPQASKEVSKDSVKTSSTAEYPVTSKRAIADNRHQTLNYSEPELMHTETETIAENEDGEDADEFYQHQHELNDQYRHSIGEETQLDSADWSKSFTETPRESMRDDSDIAKFGRVAEGQQVQGVGHNPQVVVPPQQAESAVASLINQSMVSEQSGPLETSPPQLHHKEDIGRLDESREIQAQVEETLQQEPQDNSPWLHEDANTSAERWNALRGHAQQLSSGANTLSSRGGNNSPMKQAAREASPSETPLMDSNAMPGQDHDMPEIGYGHDNQSDLTDHNAAKPRPDSIVEGPLGDEYENRGLWPYEPTPDLERRGGFVHPYDRDARSIDSGVAAAVGAAPGAGLGIGTTEPAGLAKSSQASLQPERSVSSTSQDGLYMRPQGPRKPPRSDRQYSGPSPNAHKDEGYISAAPPKSPSIGSPLSFSKPPPQLFDDRDVETFDAAKFTAPAGVVTSGGPLAGPMESSKHDRHLSVNSHGIPAEGYDAATGTGINNIHSKDVVALMDHLTVRDAHRNARDTEILVTLVRSAAEMRNNFDELKNFVDMQGQVSRRHNSNDAKEVVSKIMTGTRAAALSSGAAPRSSRFTSPSSEKTDEPPVKKKNIFKRALSGLGSRNEKDLSKIEDMLVQLLDDVDSLKDAHASSLALGSQQSQALPARTSLDSYERLRAAPESGYEPDGQAGTSSTPNASGTFSPANSRQSAHRMHSGYNVTRDPNSRISTVLEHPDENTPPDPRYENDDGMITPTQEAHNQRAATATSVAGNTIPSVGASDYHTPPSGGHSRGFSGGNVHLTPNTPRSGDPKGRQKSVSSSVFGGVPRISRWSKTTTSSAPRDSFQRDRPYSEASRSGSDVNVLPGADGEPYEPHDDDRLRSANSLQGDGQASGRSPSPLLPEHDLPMDDPKYRANRHSLTLQHPQPRQGSTHRHQSHLESEAYNYAGKPMSDKSSEGPANPGSPPGDVFGSNPGLAKNRFSVRGSRSRGTSGEYGTPQSTGSGGYRAPPKPRDEGPLVPQQAQAQAPARKASGNDRRDSLDSLSGEPYDDGGTSQNSFRRHESQAPTNTRHADPDAHSSNEDSYDGEEDDVPHNTRHNDWDSPHTTDDEDEAQWPEHSIGVPNERPRSPYYPGAQLTTIEERYSLEQSRRSSPLSRHQSVRSRDYGGSQSIREEDEEDEEGEGDVDTLGDENDSTPTGSPVKSGGEGIGNGARKVTPSGPRAMPGRVVSGRRVRV